MDRPWSVAVGHRPLAAARSQDGGRTWESAASPADAAAGEVQGFADLAADQAGDFHAVWLDGRAGGQGLYAARSADDGITWSPSAELDPRTCECCWNDLAAATDGRLLALYRDADPRDLALAASDDRGATWRRFGPVGSFGWAVEGCPHVGGAIAVSGAAGETLHALSWTGAEDRVGLHLMSSVDGGRSWSPPRLLDPAARNGDLAAGGESLLVVFDRAEAGGRQILAALLTATDGGATDGRAATDGGAAATDGGATHFAPELADGGATHFALERLSAAGTDASHPLAAWTGDGFFVAWTEREAGGALRLATARVEAPGRR